MGKMKEIGNRKGVNGNEEGERRGVVFSFFPVCNVEYFFLPEWAYKNPNVRQLAIPV